MEAVARKLVGRYIVSEVAALRELDQQVSDEIDELLLRPGDMFTAVQECPEFAVVVAVIARP